MLRYFHSLRTAGTFVLRGAGPKVLKAGTVFGTGAATGANVDWRTWFPDMIDNVRIPGLGFKMAKKDDALRLPPPKSPVDATAPPS